MKELIEKIESILWDTIVWRKDEIDGRREALQQIKTLIQAHYENKWVSVGSGVLPESGSRILMRAANGFINTAVYEDGKFWDNDMVPFVIVTHWQPLPPPPVKG